MYVARAARMVEAGGLLTRPEVASRCARVECGAVSVGDAVGAGGSDVVRAGGQGSLIRNTVLYLI